jgi:radical SAM protein with 4Fe4S-binding SPASM domain
MQLAQDLVFSRVLADGFELRSEKNGAISIYKNGSLFGMNEADSLEKYMSYVKGTEKGCGIIKAKLLITGACNQRCYYCSVASDWDKKGLTTQEVFLIMEKLHEAGVILLQLHGGDVSVRKDLPEVLSKADELNFIVDFFTNGSGAVWCNEAVYVAIDKMTVKPVITISLLAGDADVHDELAKYKGAFHKALNTAKRLLELKCKVKFTISVTKKSYNQIAKAYKVVNTFGCSLSIITEVYSSVDNVVNTKNLDLTKDEILHARHTTLGDSVIELVEKSCSAGVVSITIGHNGSIVGCERNTGKNFGSLLDNDLKPLIESAEYKQYMEMFYRRPEECTKCPSGLKQYCNWCPAIPFNFGVGKDKWLDFHCQMAMKRRLFWTGSDNPVAGARPSASNAFELAN